MIIIAVDPGLSGAVAVLDDGVPVHVIDVPLAGGQIHALGLRDFVAGWNPAHVVIEKVHSMPKQGVASSFKFGKTVGLIEGALCGFPLGLVTPQAWKKHHALLRQEKDASRLLALQLWPHMADLLKRKKDVDRAESMLIGRYYWWTLTGGIS